MIDKRKIAGSNIHYRFYPLEDFFESQARFGIHRIDLFGATPHVWIDAYSAPDGNEVRRQMEAHGLEPGVFVPEFSSMRYTLGSEGDAGRKTWEYIKRCFRFAGELGTEGVAISANGFLLDQEECRRWERLGDALDQVCRLAEPYGFKLLLLNHYGDWTDMARNLGDMKRCVQMAGAKRLFPAVDIASVYEAQESLEDWFRNFENMLSYVNLSNTKFDGARHHWGDGYLNLWEIMDTLERWKYEGAIGTSYMLREYLEKPWVADMRTREMFAAVCG